MSDMRISTNILTDSIVNHIRTNLSHLGDFQSQLATGKRINRQSDDPVNTSRVLKLDTTIHENEQFLENIDLASGEVATVDATLTDLTSVLHRVHELTVRASNATNGPTEHDAFAAEISQIQDHIVQIANTQFNGRFIFSGTRTNTPAYTDNGTDVVYNGTPAAGAYQRNVPISENTSETINFPGSTIFGQIDTVTPNTFGVFGTISGLLTDLANRDHAGIRARIDQLDTDIKNVVNIQTTVGSLTNRLELTRNRIEDRKINLLQDKSSISEVDLTKAIGELNKQNSIYEASLSVGSRVLQLPSLFELF